MVRYYFNIDSDYAFEKMTSFDASGSRLKTYGAPQPTAQIVSDLKTDCVQRNRAIAPSHFPG
jgi:hypothetical protein